MAVVHASMTSATLTPLRRYADGTRREPMSRLICQSSPYMGHVSIISTAHYLRWMPAVIEQANKRFERSCGALIQETAHEIPSHH